MSSNQHVLSAGLDEEWLRLRRRPSAVARARTWQITELPFADLDQLLAHTGYRVAPTRVRNDTLTALVAAARHDDLAARIVLQRILPGLLAVIRRRRRSDDGSFEELIGAAWMSIRACHTERQPHQVAANLVRDAAHRAFVAPHRRLSASEIVVDPHTLEETPYDPLVSACEELANLLAEARAAGLPNEDLDFVRDLVVVGSPSRLATQRQITPRTVRNHRDRATARLRDVALNAA